MATKILDSWALLALFNEEPAAAAVEKILHAAAAGRDTLLMHAINWGEIFYTTMRRGGATMADSIAADIAAMPVTIVGFGDDLALVRQAAIFKATQKISYADAFAAALAKIRKAELVTGDPEFKVLEKEIRISWLKH